MNQFLALGPVGVVLVALGGAGWRVLTFLAVRLFNEDGGKPKGLIVRAVEAHLAAVEQQSSLLRSIEESLEQQTQVVRSLESRLGQLAMAQERLACRYMSGRGQVGLEVE